MGHALKMENRQLLCMMRKIGSIFVSMLTDYDSVCLDEENAKFL